MSSDKGPGPREASSERHPQKPTREAAVASDDPSELKARRADPTGMGKPRRPGDARRDVPGQTGSARRQPHVPEHDADAEIQDELPSPTDVPVLPANAAGRDKVTTGEQDQPIDDASMYDHRPERDKDRPPSERGE
jgi:hypothetical protein